MGSLEEKKNHSRRIKDKKKASRKRVRVRSVIAKDLLTSGKYKPRIVKDRHGKRHDLNTMSHYDLVQAIQETEDYGD